MSGGPRYQALLPIGHKLNTPPKFGHIPALPYR
jgi:hypothetical protein